MRWPDGDTEFGRPPGFELPIECVYQGRNPDGEHVWRATVVVAFDVPPTIHIGKLPGGVAVIVDFDRGPHE